METYAIIITLDRIEAIVHKIDFSQGIEKAIVQDKMTFSRESQGSESPQHSVMKDGELYLYYDPENLVKINGLSFKVIQEKKIDRNTSKDRYGLI